MLLIILELFKGDNYTRRFSELKNRLPDITAKILSERLQELEAEGIISKTVDAITVPVKSKYTLTESGVELLGAEMEDRQHFLRQSGVQTL